MAKRQGFGVPSEDDLSEKVKLYKKYLNYPHYIRKHVYNAEPDSRGGCSIFTLSLEDINEVIRQTIDDGKFHYQRGSRVVFEKMFDYQIRIGLNGEAVICCRLVCNCYSFELPENINLQIMEKLNRLDIVTAYPINKLSMLSQETALFPGQSPFQGYHSPKKAHLFTLSQVHTKKITFKTKKQSPTKKDKVRLLCDQ